MLIPWAFRFQLLRLSLARHAGRQRRTITEIPDQTMTFPTAVSITRLIVHVKRGYEFTLASPYPALPYSHTVLSPEDTYVYRIATVEA